MTPAYAQSSQGPPRREQRAGLTKTLRTGRLAVTDTAAGQPKCPRVPETPRQTSAHGFRHFATLTRFQSATGTPTCRRFVARLPVAVVTQAIFLAQAPAQVTILRLVCVLFGL
jgi:hypothetical protein